MPVPCMVSVVGIEPTISCAQDRRDSTSLHAGRSAAESSRAVSDLQSDALTRAADLAMLGVLPGNRTQPFVRLTGGCRHQSGGEYRWFGRKESNLRAIDSESIRHSRARPNDGSGGRIRTVFDSFKDCLAASAHRNDLECGARIELASLAWKARAHATRPTARLSARRGDRTHLQQIKNLLPHQSAWRAWSSREIARARSSHHVDYSVFKVAITRR